jgi:hypothetical protein
VKRVNAEAQAWLDGERFGDPARKRHLDHALSTEIRSFPTADLRRLVKAALRHLYNSMDGGREQPPESRYVPATPTLLSTGMQTKVAKGEKYGYMTFTLSLMPERKAGGFFAQGRINTCPMAGVCAKGCIDETGQYRMSPAWVARLWRTHLLYACPTLFHALLDREIEGRINTARKKGKRPCFRLNTLSDLDWRLTVERWSTVDGLGPEPERSPIFYDYTKVIMRGREIMREVPQYHLAFSKSERMPWAEARGLVALGHRVAVVVDCRPKDEHPTVPGFTTVDGDAHDLIFLAGEGERGCFITLAFKCGVQRGAALAASIADGFTAGVDRPTNTVVVQ